MMLLLVVQDVAIARGGGVLLYPVIDAPTASRTPFGVRLELPDGSAQETRAVFELPHVRGPNGARGLVRLLELTVDGVPIGTRVLAEPFAAV
jgi:hypothetical protein